MILQFSQLNNRVLVYTMNKYAYEIHSCWARVFVAMVEVVSKSVRTYCYLFVRKSSTNSCNLTGLASLLITI